MVKYVQEAAKRRCVVSGDYIDIETAMRELGVSRVTLYRLMRQFGVKRYKFPGKRRVMVRREDLEPLRQPQERDGAEGKAAA